VFFFQSCDVVMEVYDEWVLLTDGRGRVVAQGHPQPMANTQVWEPPRTQRSLLFLSSIISFLFSWIFLICPLPPCVFEFF
jgi:hypothetical protein